MRDNAIERISKTLDEILNIMDRQTDKIYDNSKRIGKLEEDKKC